MSKPVKSTDPRKAEIVARLKAENDCTKVTCVREDKDCYSGNCFTPGNDQYGNRKYTFKGRFTIPKEPKA